MDQVEIKLVADVVIVADRRVVLVRYRDTTAYDGQRGWFVPDDFLQHGEHPEDAAKRIAKTQVGVDLSEVRLSHIESFADGAWHLIFHFAATLGDVPEGTPGPNVDALEWFELDGLPPADETAHGGWTLDIVERASSS